MSAAGAILVVLKELYCWKLRAGMNLSFKVSCKQKAFGLLQHKKGGVSLKWLHERQGTEAARPLPHDAKAVKKTDPLQRGGFWVLSHEF